jgi:glycolate oxidase iron-sulfur subunit
MQTQLLDTIKATEQGQEAEAILRTCVHCGMCNATCPTYQLLGDELDGPRGRIYLIKQVLEGKTPTIKTQTHLDRCLTCLSCETTCPSGVQYGRLLEIGRELVEQNVGRSWSQKIIRSSLKNALSNPRLFQHALKIGRAVSGLLPKHLSEKIPATTQHSGWPQTAHTRKVLLLDGCVQPGLAPEINAATARVLDRLNIQAMLAPQAGCCGAVRLHLNDQSGAIASAKRNIDAWWPLLKPESASGVEVIVMTASGCGVMVKDYGQLLKHDAEYADKALLISQLTCDLSEFLPNFENELIAKIGGYGGDNISANVGANVGTSIKQRVTWHPPCTLQHGQKIRGKVEELLRHLGLDVQLCVDSHLCCGSAGTYSILQSDLAQKLRQQKVAALEATEPELIVSANMACQQHLQAATTIPVKHWIELLDQILAELPSALPSALTKDLPPCIKVNDSVNELASTEARSLSQVDEGMSKAVQKKAVQKKNKSPSSHKNIRKSNVLDGADVDLSAQKTVNKRSKKKT